VRRHLVEPMLATCWRAVEIAIDRKLAQLPPP
jgi:hypothetical protein